MIPFGLYLQRMLEVILQIPLYRFYCVWWNQNFYCVSWKPIQYNLGLFNTWFKTAVFWNVQDSCCFCFVLLKTFCIIMFWKFCGALLF